MTTENSIKLLIIGDFLIFRSGLGMLLEAEKNFKVIGEAGNIKEAAALLVNNQPDIFLIDSAEIDKPNYERFNLESEGIPVLVLTNATDFETRRKYLLLGANGIVSKEHHSDVLFKAIRRVVCGDFWFDRQLIGQTIKDLIEEKKSLPPRSPADDFPPLTEREKEVLSYICKGMKNKVIADNLFITETTVRHHLTSVFEKLAVKSRLELVVYAFNKQLVEIPARIHGDDED